MEAATEGRGGGRMLWWLDVPHGRVGGLLFPVDAAEEEVESATEGRGGGRMLWWLAIPHGRGGGLLFPMDAVAAAEEEVEAATAESAGGSTWRSGGERRRWQDAADEVGEDKAKNLEEKPMYLNCLFSSVNLFI